MVTRASWIVEAFQGAFQLQLTPQASRQMMLTNQAQRAALAQRIAPCPVSRTLLATAQKPITVTID